MTATQKPEHMHSRRLCGSNTRDAVLNDKALLWKKTHDLGCVQVNIGCRFWIWDLIAAEHIRADQLHQASTTYTQLQSLWGAV